MSTSGTFSFTVTRDDLIREAMLNIGKLDAYGQIDPIENTDICRKLNMMVKQWMGRYDFAPGLKVWTRQRGELFLSSTTGQYDLGPTSTRWAGGVSSSMAIKGQMYLQNNNAVVAVAGATALNVGAANIADFTAGDYLCIQLDTGDTFTTTVSSIASPNINLTTALPSQVSGGNLIYNWSTPGQRPLEIVTCVLRDINNNDTPIDFMTVQTYEALPTKTSTQYTSDPAAIYYEAQLGNGQLYLDCGGAGDVTKHLHIVYLQPIMDFNNPLDNPEYPAEWFSALAWGLSRQICPMFNAPWTDLMEANYKEAIAYAKEANPDTTELYFRCNMDNP